MKRLDLDFNAPRGPEAARLRQRRAVLLRQLRRPADLGAMLPGSLSLSTPRALASPAPAPRRCG